MISVFADFSRALPVIACLAVCACDAQAPVAKTPSVPAAALPADILRGLNTDEAVLACFAGEAGAPLDVESAWFETQHVDLDGDGQRDWLVAAQDPCLRGANDLSWVYLARAGTHRLAARIGATVEIEQNAGSAAVELVADGAQRYRYGADVFTRLSASLSPRFTGQWRALSEAYTQLDPLSIRAGDLDAGTCSDATFDIVSANKDTATLALSSDCRLGRDAIAVMALAVGDNVCKMEVTLYASRAAARNEDLFAWGVFERPSCP